MLIKMFECADYTAQDKNTYANLVETLHFGTVMGGLTPEGCRIALAQLEQLKVEVLAAAQVTGEHKNILSTPENNPRHFQTETE